MTPVTVVVEDLVEVLVATAVVVAVATVVTVASPEPAGASPVEVGVLVEVSVEPTLGSEGSP